MLITFQNNYRPFIWDSCVVFVCQQSRPTQGEWKSCTGRFQPSGGRKPINHQPANKHKLSPQKEKNAFFSWSNEFWGIEGVEVEIEWPLLGNSAEKSPAFDNGWVKWAVSFLWNRTFNVSKKVPTKFYDLAIGSGSHIISKQFIMSNLVTNKETPVPEWERNRTGASYFYGQRSPSISFVL